MRYICKACGRKRESDRLKEVGKAKNGLNVWLCRDGSSLWSNCNPEAYERIFNSFAKDLDVIEQELEDKRQRDLDFLHSMQRKRL